MGNGIEAVSLILDLDLCESGKCNNTMNYKKLEHFFRIPESMQEYINEICRKN